MWRPRWAALIAVVLLISSVALVGCGAGAGDRRDRNVLRVWLLEANTPEIGRGYTNLVADFERQRPGVTVELSRVPYQQYRDKLVLAMRGGTGPDVMMLDQIWVAEFAAARMLTSLDPMIRSAPELTARNYFGGAWVSNQWSGRSWGLPLNADVWERMFYNADLFRAAGLDPDRPPKTWPEWVAAAKKLQRPGSFGIGLIGCRDEASAVLTDSLVYSAGGSVVTGNRADFVSPENVRAYTLYRQLADYAPGGVPGACAEDVMAQFTAGNTGMMLGGGWNEEKIKESAKFKWRVTVPPAPTGRQFVGALGGWNLVVNAKAADPATAFAFIRLATTSVTHQMAVNDSVPALRTAGRRFVATRTNPAEMLNLLETGKPRPVTPAYARISRAQQDVVQAILAGTPVPEALTKAQGKMQAAIDNP